MPRYEKIRQLLREQIANADVLMTTWHSPFLTEEMLGSRPRVKLIAHCGGEVKARVAEEIFDYVTVTNAADPMARGVAEMALALVLTLVRRIPDYAAEMRDGVIRPTTRLVKERVCRDAAWAWSVLVESAVSSRN